MDPAWITRNNPEQGVLEAVRLTHSGPSFDGSASTPVAECQDLYLPHYADACQRSPASRMAYSVSEYFGYPNDIATRFVSAWWRAAPERRNRRPFDVPAANVAGLTPFVENCFSIRSRLFFLLSLPPEWQAAF